MAILERNPAAAAWRGIAACLVALASAAAAFGQTPLPAVNLPEGPAGFLAEGRGDAAPLADLPAACGDCCPSWRTYAIFDVLFLQWNANIGDRPLVYDSQFEPVMTTLDLTPRLGTGTRAFFGSRVTDNWGWEVGYTGIYGVFNSATATGPGSLQLPPDIGSVVTNFGDANQVRGTYWSSLEMAEFNLFRYDCCAETGRAWGHYMDCRPNCHCLDWMAGFVWAGLNDRAALAATCCDPPETSTYAVRTTTNYFGPQIGMRGRREWCRWAVEGWWKAAVCGTAANQTQAPIFDTVTNLQERGELRSSDGGVGFIGSLNATLIYRITKMWGLRVGYNVYTFTNAALAPPQWDFSTASTAGTTLNDNGSVFLHGLNLGAEARW